MYRKTTQILEPPNPFLKALDDALLQFRKELITKEEKRIKEYEALFLIGDLDDDNLGLLLDCLTLINMNHLRKNPNIPDIFESGIRYQHDGGDDPWMDLLMCLRAKEKGIGSDCEDIACWFAAQCRIRHKIAASPCFVRMPRRIVVNGKEKTGEEVHIFVRLPGNKFYDPCVPLGMQPVDLNKATSPIIISGGLLNMYDYGDREPEGRYVLPRVA